MKIGVHLRSRIVDRRPVGGVEVSLGNQAIVLTPNQVRRLNLLLEAALRVAEDPTQEWSA